MHLKVFQRFKRKSPELKNDHDLDKIGGKCPMGIPDICHFLHPRISRPGSKISHTECKITQTSCMLVGNVVRLCHRRLCNFVPCWLQQVLWNTCLAVVQFNYNWNCNQPAIVPAKTNKGGEKPSKENYIKMYPPYFSCWLYSSLGFIELEKAKLCLSQCNSPMNQVLNLDDGLCVGVWSWNPQSATKTLAFQVCSSPELRRRANIFVWSKLPWNFMCLRMLWWWVTLVVVS